MGSGFSTRGEKQDCLFSLNTKPKYRILSLVSTSKQTIDPALASREITDLWSELLLQYPSLSCVECVFGSKESADMQFMPGPPPKMFFPEHAPLAIFEHALETRPVSCQLVCELLGIPKVELTPQLLRVFIFLHECGHAHDFVENFCGFSTLEHPENSIKRFEEACMRCNERQDIELKSLPIPMTPSGFLASRRESPDYVQSLVSEYLKKPDVTEEDFDAVLQTLERAYKALPSESYADAFAKRFLVDRSMKK